MTVIDILKTYVLTEIAPDLGIQSLEPDQDLLEEGIVDSLGVVSLIEYIEARFEVEILDEEVVPENFQTLEAMAAFVEQKLGRREKIVSA